MDTDLLRTFLEVNRTRHFGQAAENLYLTQSAVSSRIRLLESIVGIPLFSRARGDIQLTAAGSKLIGHAEQILNSWNRARQQISVEDEGVTPIVVGSVPSIWDSVLQNWLHRIYIELKRLSITTEINTPEALLRKVSNGSVDLAFMFSSPQVSELMAAEIGEVALVLVSSKKGLSVAEATSSNYIKVDWGTPFEVAHARELPDIPPPMAHMAHGQHAHQFILNCGGNAFLSESSVSSDIAAGSLYRVEGAPVITRAAYAVYATKASNRSLIEETIDYLEVA